MSVNKLGSELRLNTYLIQFCKGGSCGIKPKIDIYGFIRQQGGKLPASWKLHQFPDINPGIFDTVMKYKSNISSKITFTENRLRVSTGGRT